MKVVSILQPWATLAVIGAKKIETRSWNTKYRGELLIHASQKFDYEQQQLCLSELFLSILKAHGQLEHERKSEWMAHGKFLFPRGAIIGKVNLCSTVESQFCFLGNEFSTDSTDKITHVITEQELAFGDYSAGRYGWLLSDPVEFKDHHYPVKGSLGLWNLDERICLQCGCTENDACVHPDFGPCWWVEENLCSHCEEGVFKSKIPTR